MLNQKINSLAIVRGSSVQFPLSLWGISLASFNPIQKLTQQATTQPISTSLISIYTSKSHVYHRSKKHRNLCPTRHQCQIQSNTEAFAIRLSLSSRWYSQTEATKPNIATWRPITTSVNTCSLESMISYQYPPTLKTRQDIEHNCQNFMFWGWEVMPLGWNFFRSITRIVLWLGI